MIVKNYLEDWADYEEDVRKYMSAHFGTGWEFDVEELKLTNPNTDEFCSIYVADDEDFEPHSSDYNVLRGLDNWLEFGLFVENRDEKLYMQEQFKYIKYHVIISKSHKKLVLLNKAYIWYCSDSGCILRYARRADVVDLQEEK